MIKLKNNFKKEGYLTNFKLNKKELNILRNSIRKQYLKRILNLYPEHYNLFNDIPMEYYHLISNYIDHKKCWTKKERCLPNSDVNVMKKFLFIKKFKKSFSDFFISDESNIESN